MLIVKVRCFESNGAALGATRKPTQKRALAQAPANFIRRCAFEKREKEKMEAAFARLRRCS